MLTPLSQQFKHTIADIWSFLKHPHDNPGAERTTSGKLRVLVLVLCIYLVLSITLGGLLEALSRLGWYNTDNHAIADLMRAVPFGVVLLLGVFIIPFLEELVFRFGLRFKRGYISFVVTVTLLIAGCVAFYSLPLMGALAVMVGLIVFSVLYFLNTDVIFNSLRRVWPRIYGVVFYTIAILFGLIHIANYKDFNYASAAILLVPVLVAPQIIGGLLMGYMRVKHGFFWGYFLHAGHNAFLFLVGFAFMNAVEEKLHVKDDAFTLKVEEHMKYEPDAETTSYLGHDSIAFVNQKLNEVILVLLQKERPTVDFDKTRHQHTRVNLSFKNRATDADITQSRKLVLDQLQELYKFDVDYRSRKIDAWDLAIEDSTVLAAHAVEDIGKSTITRSTDSIKLENVTLDELITFISKDFKVMLISDRESRKKGKYNFELARKDINHLKKDLKTRYGILLQSRMELSDKVIVKFRR